MTQRILAQPLGTAGLDVRRRHFLGSRNYLGEGAAARDEGEVGEPHADSALVLGEFDHDGRVRGIDSWPHDLPAPSFDRAVAIWPR